MTTPDRPRRRRRPDHAGRPSRPATDRHSAPGRPRATATPTPPVVLDPDATFASLGVPTPLVAELVRQGIESPFPIQVATLPDTLAGRDVLGRGRTGSGKTLAFSLPMVSRLTGGSRRARQPRALVLVPTRELANQVLAVVAPLANAARLTSTVVFGGVGQNPQVKALARGVDILIACPGRLEDLIGQGHCDLSAVEITVLDEADHMADLGFLPCVKRILDQTPGNGQRMLFSATLDNGVDVLVRRYLHEPTTHSVDPVVAPVSTMTHHVFSVSAADKPKVVHELAAGHERSLLFMRTKHTAKKLAKQLTAAGIPAVDLHGNLSQRKREQNLAAFTDGSARVLVATDIAARGIHVDDIALVVHVDPPTEHKAYLHRSGRTARAGAGGTVITLAMPDQARDVRNLAKQAGIRPSTVTVQPGAAEIGELVGPPAPYVTPPVVVDEPVRQPRGNSGRRSARTKSTTATSGAPKRGGRSGGGGRGGANAPARTRAELAARAGQQPPRRRSGR
ncbi:MAG TPA: DEAD/DEAH box helicase [Acidimicrobiales bacterium]|nr:DEAD/DEAH box helicase [Acidimicrobiales bacterium]